MVSFCETFNFVGFARKRTTAANLQFKHICIFIFANSYSELFSSRTTCSFLVDYDCCNTFYQNNHSNTELFYSMTLLQGAAYNVM